MSVQSSADAIACATGAIDVRTAVLLHCAKSIQQITSGEDVAHVIHGLRLLAWIPSVRRALKAAEGLDYVAESIGHHAGRISTQAHLIDASVEVLLELISDRAEHLSSFGGMNASDPNDGAQR